jgi:hypothetical protein
MNVHVTSRVWSRSEARNGNRLVLLAIADCANHDGWAWPSISYLKAMTQLSESSVHAAIVQLVKDKELKVGYKQGPHGCNMYQVLTESGGDAKPEVREILETIQKAADGTLQDLVSTLQYLARTLQDPDPNHKEPEENQTPPYPPTGEESDEEPLDALFTADFEQGFVETVAPSKPRDDDPGFLAFWSVYPRHIAKQPARKAWRTAIRGGAVPGEIIAGAEHYRDDHKRKSKGIEFTAHPATWLNGQRWLDWAEEENAAKYRYSNNPFEN